MKNKVVIIIGIIFWGVVLFLIITLGPLLTQYLKNIDPNILVALIAGMFTVTGYFISRYLERKKIIEQQIREQKLPVYEEFLSFVFEIIRNVKNGKETTAEEMEVFMINFNKKSIIWLSDKSLKAYLKWKNTASNLSSKNNDMQATIRHMLVLEEMFYEFRKDIGHSNKNLKPGDLLSLFINDLDKYNLNK